MLSYKYFLNTVTRTVSKLACNSCRIILQILSYHSHTYRYITRSYRRLILSYKYLFDTVTRMVSKVAARILPCYHVNILLAETHVT